MGVADPLKEKKKRNGCCHTDYSVVAESKSEVDSSQCSASGYSRENCLPKEKLRYTIGLAAYYQSNYGTCVVITSTLEINSSLEMIQ